MKKRCICGETIISHAEANHYFMLCANCNISAKAATKSAVIEKWNGKIGQKKHQMNLCQKSIKATMKILNKYYPHKDIAEYTRLEEAMNCFLIWGLWS